MAAQRERRRMLSTTSLVLACASALARGGLGDDAGRPDVGTTTTSSTSELGAPAPLWNGAPEVVPGLEEIACAECHADVAGEWKSTLHALAWVDEAYQDDWKKKRRPQGCWGCHAPEPLFPDLPRRPRPRDDDRHLGVTCETCHRGPDGGIVGPWGLEVDAHPSTRSEHFVGAGSIELCASCHATTIGPVVGVAKDFDASGDRTCVGCHMAPVERRLADGTTRAGRSHALQTPRDPAFLALAFDVELVREPEPFVRVANRAGHRVPGLVGRVITFQVDVFDGDRRTRRVEHALDTVSYLPAGGELAIPIEPGDDDTHVRIVGLHADPRLGREVEFHSREHALR